MSSDKKKFVLCLYISGLSFRAIAKIVNVHHSAVHRFIKKYAQDNYEKPEPCEDAVIKLELDEMWHYIQNKKTNSGFGKLTAETQDNLSTGNAEIETLPL